MTRARDLNSEPIFWFLPLALSKRALIVASRPADGACGGSGRSLGRDAAEAQLAEPLAYGAVRHGGDKSDQAKMALLGGAAIIIAMLLWIYFSFLN